MELTAEQIALALGAKRPSGKGSWMVCCPAHTEKTPSFRISERDGKILVKCFGGCAQREVIAALRSRGLWFPETAQQRQRFQQQQRQQNMQRMQMLKHIVDADRKSGRDAQWTEADRKKAAEVDRMFPKGAPPIDLGNGWHMHA